MKVHLLNILQIIILTVPFILIVILYIIPCQLSTNPGLNLGYQVNVLFIYFQLCPAFRPACVELLEISRVLSEVWCEFCHFELVDFASFAPFVKVLVEILFLGILALEFFVFQKDYT